MDLFHWERFEPRLGDNHSLPPEKRFFLEVACGLTKVQLKGCERALDFSKLHLDAGAVVEEAKKSKAEDESHEEALQRVGEQRMGELCIEQLARAWAPFIRIGAGQHTLDGKPVATLKDYLSAVIAQPGRFNVIELSKVLAQLNSVIGTHALFSERLSGGPISTVGPSTDAAAAATGSR